MPISRILLVFSELALFVSCENKLWDGPSNAIEMTKFTKSFEKSTIKNLIEDNGFGYESYKVITEDGYILNLNRMVNPNQIGNNRGYPLLLVSGFGMHSDSWFLQDRTDASAAFTFSRLGYDVWLGDQRGTIRSRAHVNMTTEDPKYWDFSIHETGVYDLPAFIDFILEKTNNRDLVYNCVSLGCTFHAVLLSEKPSYNDKLRGAMLFAPVTSNLRKIEDMPSFLITSIFALIKLGDVLEKRDVEMFSATENGRKRAYYLCQSAPALRPILTQILFGSTYHIPEAKVCRVLALTLGGTSVKTAKHLVQFYLNDAFAQYDYGRKENLIRYGTELPPLYDVTKIKKFVALYYSDADIFLSVEGTEKTMKLFGTETYGCKLPNFSHMDLAAGGTFWHVMPDVIEVMNAMTGYKNNTEKLNSGKCPSMEWIRFLAE